MNNCLSEKVLLHSISSCRLCTRHCSSCTTHTHISHTYRRIQNGDDGIANHLKGQFYPASSMLLLGNNVVWWREWLYYPDEKDFRLFIFWESKKRKETKIQYSCFRPLNTHYKIDNYLYFATCDRQHTHITHHI